MFSLSSDDKFGDVCAVFCGIVALCLIGLGVWFAVMSWNEFHGSVLYWTNLVVPIGLTATSWGSGIYIGWHAYTELR